MTATHNGVPVRAPGTPSQRLICCVASGAARCGTACLVVACVLTLLLGCSPAEQQATSTRRMAERLEAIARDADPATHAYINDRRVVYFREQIDELRASAAANTPSGKQALQQAHYALASELLRDGQFEEAVAELRGMQTTAEARFQLRETAAVAQPQLQQTLQLLIGVAYLRLGEQQNCILNHTIESCLLPIRGAGVHQDQRGSRAAVEEFLGVLRRNPRDATARWLLNIAYMTLGEYPQEVPPQYLIPPLVFRSGYDIGRFDDVAPATGLDLVALSGGAIMEDFDGDGHLDIVASSWGLRDQLHYFRNTATGTFEDRTVAAGLSGIVGGLNTKHADYDNSGSADVLVLRGAWLDEQGRYPNSLLANRGDGTFVDVTEEAGLMSLKPTHSGDWGDFDNDGWLDLFVGAESPGEHIHPCELFRNEGDSAGVVRFTDVAEATNTAVVGWVKGVVWGDYDNDGRLDLYVSRLSPDEPNMLLRNDGGDDGAWHFTDVAREAGVTGPPFSFPVWFWDYDNDGWQDILALGFRGDVGDVAADYLGLPHDAEMPRLYHNRGDGTFADVTRGSGLDEPLITMGSNYGDLDNDGFPDAYIGTGDPYMVTIVPNRMFRNDGGRRFQDVTTSGGFGTLQKGHGVAFGDIDHDGDQDVFAVIGGAFTGDVYQNVLFRNPGHGNHWLKVRLEGRRSNRCAIGARIDVTVDTPDGVRHIHQTVTSGGSFGSHSLLRQIGLGDATAVRSLEVFWPASGERQHFTGVPMDRYLVVREGDPSPTLLDFEPFGLAGTGLPEQHRQTEH